MAVQDNSNEFKRLGKLMGIMALCLTCLTFFFAKQQEKSINPNLNPSSFTSPDGTKMVTLKRNRFGHYMASGLINGHPVTFLLDTGATTVAIPASLQNKLQLTPGRAYNTQTANGLSISYQTRIQQLSIGSIQLFDVDASLAPGLTGQEVLLGMSVLKQLDFEQKGNELTLRQ